LICSINELKTKEVINVSDGARLGFVSDVEIDLESGRMTALVVPGAYRLMGFLGKEEDIIIKWENIKKIGDDIIIIDNIN
jgi:YlmC/YmxH family sporulation protein